MPEDAKRTYAPTWIRRKTPSGIVEYRLELTDHLHLVVVVDDYDETLYPGFEIVSKVAYPHVGFQSPTEAEDYLWEQLQGIVAQLTKAQGRLYAPLSEVVE